MSKRGDNGKLEERINDGKQVSLFSEKKMFGRALVRNRSKVCWIRRGEIREEHLKWRGKG